MVRGNRFVRRAGPFGRNGFILPLVVFSAAVLFIVVATIAYQTAAQSRQTVASLRASETESYGNEGIQHGLVFLNKRLSYLPDRILNGMPDGAGGVRYLSNTDVQNYVTTPALFWVDMMNGIEENGEPVPTQPDFLLEDANNAAFALETASHTIIVRLVSAFHIAPIEAENTSGYNNVTLRYGYKIISTEKMSVAGSNEIGRTVTVESSIRPEHIDYLIQIHLVRELSRYNLFAENNTTSDGLVMYDRTTYGGRVYSRGTLYVTGAPRFNGDVEISNQASPAFYHKDTGTDFIFRKSDGSLNPPRIIEPLSLPSTSDMGFLRDMCHKMSLGQNPDALTNPGIYVGTSSVGGVERVTTVYVNGNDAVPTQIRISLPVSGTNQFQIDRVGTGESLIVTHYVGEQRSFLIFVDGDLWIDGVMSEGTQLTVSARDDIKVTNNLVYESGSVSAQTVAGLVSWQGNILVAKDIPPDPGSTIKNLRIHGVLMAVNGAFGAEGFEDFPGNYMGYAGTINHIGAFIRKWNLPTLSADGTRGWGIVTAYDPYLAEAKAPPYFPANSRYKLVDERDSQVVDVYHKKRI